MLLLHGFTGSPWEVRPLAEALAARGYFVHCPLLPGHGSTGEAMLFVDHRDWVRAAIAAQRELEGAQHFIFAGLSMGALLSLALAGREPEKLRGLVLMAPAWKLRGKSGRLVRRLRWLGLHGLKARWLYKKTTDLMDPDGLAQAPILPRYPLARLFDLFLVRDLAKEALPRVRCPTLLISAENDHVIDGTGIDALERKLRQVTRVRLNEGAHIIPRDRDRARLNAEVSEFVDRLCPSP